MQGEGARASRDSISPGYQCSAQSTEIHCAISRGCTKASVPESGHSGEASFNATLAEPAILRE